MTYQSMDSDLIFARKKFFLNMVVRKKHSEDEENAVAQKLSSHTNVRGGRVTKAP